MKPTPTTVEVPNDGGFAAAAAVFLQGLYSRLRMLLGFGAVVMGVLVLLSGVTGETEMTFKLLGGESL